MAVKDDIISGALVLHTVVNVVSPPSQCHDCDQRAAVYTIRVSRRPTVIDLAPGIVQLCVCYKCLPVSATKIRNKVSDQVQFGARRQHVRNKYSRLVDALEKKMAKTMQDPVLRETYECIENGGSLNQFKMKLAWSRLNA
jgi:hypothetical protein